MKFRKLWRYRRVFLLVLIIASIVLVVVLQKNYNNTICSDIKIVIKDGTNGKYITRSSVIEYIYKQTQKEIVGNTYKNIDMSEIENVLNKNFYVKKSEVYRSQNGVITINIIQREPLVRVYNEANEDFYIDREGYFLPISKNYASYVPIFNGNIPKIDSLFKNEIKNIADYNILIYSDIYDLAKELEKNKFTKTMIDQIYVNNENEFEMIPKVGNFKILFGTMEKSAEKIRNLENFYLQIAPKEGWRKYSIINLKYTNQVVCELRTKKKEL